ncbi:MAG: response regulator transcription factor [Planctomycetes bacterium]|nr:response regulator transcription factor [Planctomycetota bacterium]
MNEPKGRLLIVEDDAAIADGLALNLRLEGFSPTKASSGEEALEAAGRAQFRLILLDINLPSVSGLEVLRTLRERGDETPIIVLSARQDEYDKVAALRLGADDYVTKPFGVAELLARIDSVLRRGPKHAVAPNAGTELLRFSTVSIDIGQRVVTRRGKPVPLTHLEFELLHHLVRNPARVLSRHGLLSAVWGLHHAGSPRTVDNFVGQLRKKLEEDPERPRHFVTVRGSGYRFDP